MMESGGCKPSNYHDFDIWREEEDLPRLEMIRQVLASPTVRVEAFPDESPDELFHHVFFRPLEVDGYPLFACVVPPGEDIVAFLGRWIEHIFPGTPIPKIEVVFPPS